MLERILGGNSAVFLRFEDHGERVRAVQFALIDLGFTSVAAAVAGSPVP